MATRTQAPTMVSAITTPTPTMVSVITTPTPTAPALPISGIEIHDIDEVELVQQAGVSWARVNGLLWGEVEPVEGVRSWEVMVGLDEKLAAISAAGIRTILVVRDTPVWAQEVAGMDCGPITPEKLQAFATFVQDAVARYSKPPYNVHYWELWNEPDVDPLWVPADSPFGCWGDINDHQYFGGEYYAEMLRSVYLQIKGADPQAVVLVGGLLLDCDPVIPPETAPGSGSFRDCTPSRFLEGVLENGGGDYFDGVSFHAYDYYLGGIGRFGNRNWHSAWNTTGPVLIAKIHYLRGLLIAYGFGSKLLINSENGLLCGQDGSEPECQGEPFLNTKASYLVQSYAAARSEGITANIWFDLHGWRGSGLVDAGREPNLAYEALRFQCLLLERTAFWGNLPPGIHAGIDGYIFYRSGSWIWVMWTISEAEQIVYFPRPANASYMLDGTSQAPEETLLIAFLPQYFEWQERP